MNGVTVERGAMFKVSYGLFILTAKYGGKDNGCIINTASQITDSPPRITFAANKSNLTHDMIIKTGEFNVSVLTENTPFRIFEQFGFHSGRNTDKFDGCDYNNRSANGIRYVPEYANGVISGKINTLFDCGTHTLFAADVTQAFVLSNEPSATYRYYLDNIKPKPQAPEEKEEKEHKKGFVCKICGYVYEGEAMPEDFICPLCKHSAENFEPM